MVRRPEEFPSLPQKAPGHLGTGPAPGRPGYAVLPLGTNRTSDEAALTTTE